MKSIIFILFCIIIFSSCEDDNHPLSNDKNGSTSQNEIVWTSLKKSPWPMYRHDPQLSGRTPHFGPSAGIITDSVPVGYEIANVVVDTDSFFYTSSASGPLPRNLSKWKYNSTFIVGKDFNIFEETYNSPILLPDQTLYYITPDNVWRLTDDTTVLWKYTPVQKVYSIGSSIDKDGNLFLKNTSPGGITVLTPAGDVHWTLSIPNSSLHAAAFSPDGNTLYVTASQLLAIDITSRSIKWTGDSIGIMTSPVVDYGGNIYCFIKERSTPNEIFASFSPSGVRRWTFSGLTSIKPNSEHGIAPVVDWDGNVYCATDTLYSFTNTGELRWKFGLNAGERNYTSLTCDGSNTIYVLTTDDNIYAVSSAGNLKWKLHIPNAWFSNTPTIADGRLFVPTAYAKKVYIIQ